MKKKLSVILMSSVIAVSCAGCQSAPAAETSDKVSSISESSTSVSESVSDISSETQNSLENSMDSYDIENSSVSSVQSNTESTDEEGTEQKIITKNLEYAFTPIDISDSNMALQSINLKEPAVHTVTTQDELKQFYDKYKTTYSLDEVDSGNPFSEVTKSCNEDYFVENDIIFVVQNYNKDEEIDFDIIYVENSELKITTLRSEPSSTDSAYTCSLIRVAKNDRGNAKPVIIISEPQEEIIESNPDVILIEDEESLSNNNPSIQTNI